MLLTICLSVTRPAFMLVLAVARPVRQPHCLCLRGDHCESADYCCFSSTSVQSFALPKPDKTMFSMAGGGVDHWGDIVHVFLNMLQWVSLQSIYKTFRHTNVLAKRICKANLEQMKIRFVSVEISEIWDDISFLF